MTTESSCLLVQGIILTVSVLVLIGIVFVGYSLWHALYHGESRRLEFFILGECDPPPTIEELYRWSRHD